jgi:hypothetical protein
MSHINTHRFLTLLALVVVVVLAAGFVQPTPNRAGVVVQFGDGGTQTACVTFDEAEINGIDLLQRARLQYIPQPTGMGAAICQIEGEGCAYPAEDCFCQCQGAPCVFWRLYTAQGNTWQLASIGASSTVVRDGDVQAWVWGGGTLTQGEAPEGITPADVCAVPSVDQPSAVPFPIASATGIEQTPTMEPQETITAPRSPSAVLIATTIPSATTPPVAGDGIAPAPSATPEGRSLPLGPFMFVGACVVLIAVILKLRRRQRVD